MGEVDYRLGRTDACQAADTVRTTAATLLILAQVYALVAVKVTSMAGRTRALSAVAGARTHSPTRSMMSTLPQPGRLRRRPFRARAEQGSRPLARSVCGDSLHDGPSRCGLGTGGPHRRSGVQRVHASGRSRARTAPYRGHKTEQHTKNDALVPAGHTPGPAEHDDTEE